MSHRWYLAVVLAAAVFSSASLWAQTPPATPRVESAAAETGRLMFGAGANSDAGVAGSIAFDSDSESSLPPAILLKLTVFEIDEIDREPSTPEYNQAKKELAKLGESGMEEIRATPGGPVQIWSTTELQKSIELMRRSGHVRILAEPSLITHSGRPASFQTGAQVPISVPQGDGTPRLEYRDIGVKATATPTYSQGSFRIDLRLESNNLISTAPPAIRSRLVQTTVEVKAGQSALLSGMVQQEDEQTKVLLTTITPTLVAWTEPDDPNAASNQAQAPVPARPAAASDREEEAAIARHEALHLIDELYPEARVQIIPLRKTVIVRGRVTRPEHAEQIAEIVSQFFPGALNHLTVKEATQTFPQGLEFSAPILLSQPTQLPPTPTASPMTPSASPNPPPPAAVRKPLPSKAPDALRDLQEEVKLLRRDVNRLIDLLEKRPGSDASDTRRVPDGGAVLLGGRSFAAFANENDLTEKTARAAEEQRAVLAQEWLGQPLPKWSSPCRIDVKTSGAAGGTTTYIFEGGAVTNLHMKLQGPEDKLPDLLAHEVMHTVLATHFGRPLPRWADEGIAAMVETGDHRKKLAGQLRECAASNKLLPLRDLFDRNEYPQDSQGVLAIYAQGLSLVEFFVERGGKQTFIRFLKDALENDDWDAALKTHYDCANCEECEEAWRAAAGLETSS